MNNLWKWASLCLLLGAVLAPATAAELTASVAGISGKVQLQKGTDWVNVTVGQVLPLGSTVSTGFRSELKLKIGPSTVTVKALSRLTISSLVQNGTDAATDLYLKVGKVNAQVNKDETVQTQKFTIKSPVATASVRGTEFSFDGVSLEVQRGLVDFTDSRGAKVAVPAGESAKAVVAGVSTAIQTHVDQILQASVTVANASAGEAEPGGGLRALLSGVEAGTKVVETLKDWQNQRPNVYVFVGGLEQ